MSQLNQRISEFYDQSTDLWLDTWGEHMHHGYYDDLSSMDTDHQKAQIRLVSELLCWGKVDNARRILDAGCGVGGSARFLARLFNAKVLGCTLSKVQAEKGKAYNQTAGLENQVTIKASDMMSLTRADGTFDLIWSMESAEHIRNKQQLFNLFYDLLEPGGTLLMATWCHRELPPHLSKKENELLQKIGDYYHLPPMVTIAALQQMAVNAGFKEVETDNWSDQVAPFWKAVIRSALTLDSLKGLYKAGWPVIKGAWAMRYMTKGYQTGLLEFGILQGQKT